MTNIIRNTTGIGPTGETPKKSGGAEQGAWGREEQRMGGGQVGRRVEGKERGIERGVKERKEGRREQGKEEGREERREEGTEERRESSKEGLHYALPQNKTK